MPAVEALDEHPSLWPDLAGVRAPERRRARRPTSRACAKATTAEMEVALASPERALFLDIETTGLSRHYDEVTIVGFEMGGWRHVHVAGDDPGELLAALRTAAVLVTFNGKLFDVPFLRTRFGELALPALHLDLRFACRRAGLVGGQKAVEATLGLRTRSGLPTDGAAAVFLWHRYLRGDVAALRELIAYNRADLVGMKAILDHLARSGRDDDLLGAPPTFVGLDKGGRGRAVEGAPLPDPHAIRRRPPSAATLFKGTDAENARVVGIDLTGSEAKPSGFALLQGMSAQTAMIGSDDELVAATLAACPALVSIDSPLSLPRGRTSVGDDDPGRAIFGIMRESERTLKRRGVNVYPCLLPSMQNLTARGIRLADRLRRLGLPVIESYPGAAQDIMGIPRKGAGERWLKLGLTEFGIQGPFSTEPVRHDELDAVTSALVGAFFLSGKFEALCGPGENALIVPRLDAPTRPLLVGVSGRIAAGKTTVARMLERRGHAYARFSQVVDEEVLARGLEPNRATRQSVGLRLHETVGQRWLCEKVLERIESCDLAVVDGLRWMEDAAFFHERYGPSFVHLHIDASPELRRDRFRDDADGRTFEVADADPVEREIDDLRRLATENVRNESTLEALERLVVQAVEANRVKELARCPSPSS